MTRTRLVIETTRKRKSDMEAAADLQGETLTEWIDEQVQVTLKPAGEAKPLAASQPTLDEILDSSLVGHDLQAVDWAFTDDDTGYLTHDVHPYPAKFIPQIPARLIDRLSLPGDLVCDPFGGSATSAVEAVRKGRRAVSFDANPLSQLIGKVKTGFLDEPARISLEQLSAAIEGHISAYGAASANWSEVLRSTYRDFVPDIPNIEKWFSDNAIGELALVRCLIERITCGVAKDAALVALSRIIVRVSNQESETRYVSEPKASPPTLALRAFCESLRTVRRRLHSAADTLQYADASFCIGDSRHDLKDGLPESSVDLIVTSPPYPNATDYHLYHRFRLFWLGYDPRALGRIEIGSHLRHQRNGSGFEEYKSDMAQVLAGCSFVLQPGRYAVFIVGDAVFKGEQFSTADAICDCGRAAGLSVVAVIERPIHRTKRSFSTAARRARLEHLVVLQKPNLPVKVTLLPPAYRLWDYEHDLRSKEIEALTGKSPAPSSQTTHMFLKQPSLWNARRLTFTSEIRIGDDEKVGLPTWQSSLENGTLAGGKRKDPKYVTHGLHAYKGKFYPQLAKSLINLSGMPLGGRLLDPFCGSGTAVLEGMLNGYMSYGCDFNPLAAKISKAKTQILAVDRDVADLAIRAMLEKINIQIVPVEDRLDNFGDGTHEELLNWFAEPILIKINWLLGESRLFGDERIINFFEVLISSLIREVSDQDPSDLRIRRRKDALNDAPVLQMFKERLVVAHGRLRKYWSIAGRQPGSVIAAHIVCGDSRRTETLDELGIEQGSIDAVVTSPPYATALPYIDTDRLSLLAVMGLSSKVRGRLEAQLTGSREIRKREKSEAEAALLDAAAMEILPASVAEAVRNIYHLNLATPVGFRKANMPALLWRYFCDMKENLKAVRAALKSGARAYYVVGDSRTEAGGSWVPIETCRHIAEIAEHVGLRRVTSIDIDVTTESLKHVKNAITRNQVIVLQKD